VLVRTDLTPAQQLCQAVHAAHEAGIRFGTPQSVSAVVVCALPDEAALRDARDRLSFKGIRSFAFHEPDLDGQMTALATEPLARDRRNFLSRYPLWRAGR
jgi:hypothetical protein